MHINISRINSIVTDDESGTDSASSSRRESKINHHLFEHQINGMMIN